VNRRLFLKGLCLSAAAATVTLRTKGRGDYQIYDDPTVQTEGFGLAPVKAEGTSVLYDRHGAVHHQPRCPCGQYHDDYLKPWIKDEDEWYIMTHRAPAFRSKA